MERSWGRHIRLRIDHSALGQPGAEGIVFKIEANIVARVAQCF
jgi:hypothetical protein